MQVELEGVKGLLRTILRPIGHKVENYRPVQVGMVRGEAVDSRDSGCFAMLI